MDERVATLDDPRTTGKALTGALGGLWRYRVGDYRLVCDIQDGNVRVLVCGSATAAKFTVKETLNKVSLRGV